MTKIKKTLIFFLDAVREDYITKENTPFLFKLKKKETFMNLIPLLWYSSGIHPTIWTWKYQESHWDFLIYGYDKKNSPFWRMRFLSLFPEKIKQYILASLKAPYYLFGINKKYFPQWYIKKILSIPASIHPKLAGYFKPMNDPFKNTFFEIMKENNIYLFSQPNNFNKNYWKGIPVQDRYISENDIDHYFIWETDGLWHYPWPNSKPLLKLMNQLDKKIKELYNQAIKKHKKINLFIFSDHWMEEIIWTVDVKSILERLPLKIEKDYIVFYDSTFVRFRIKNKEAEKIIIKELSKIKHLTYLNKKLKDKYKINFTTKKWGDLFFIADNGYRIFPDNFAPVKFNTKWMHGYFPEDNKNAQWIFITNTFASKKKEIDVIDMFPTLLKSLWLEKLTPKDIDGKAIF